VSSITQWWKAMGSKAYPQATRTRAPAAALLAQPSCRDQRASSRPVAPALSAAKFTQPPPSGSATSLRLRMPSGYRWAVRPGRDPPTRASMRPPRRRAAATESRYHEPHARAEAASQRWPAGA
jgi:hypothetical protein